MADVQYNTRQEARKGISAAMQENSRKLRQALKDNDQQAIAKYIKENDRLEAQYRATDTLGAAGSGIASTAIGLLTGLPDLAIEGYNLYQSKRAPSLPELVAGKQGLFGEQAGKLPTLRERALEFAQIPAQAPAKEDAAMYMAPDIAVGVAGLANLAQLGFKGIKNWLQGRQTKDLLGKLDPAEKNFFEDLMLKGQGSPNTEVAAKLARLQSDPKYAELINSLQRAASERSVSGMAPAASRISEKQAGASAAEAVQAKIEGLAEARKVAGDLSFSQAFGYGADRQLVDPAKTIKNIDSLIGQYSKKATPNAERAVEVLNSLKSRLETLTAPPSPFAGVGGGVQPSRLKTVEEVQGILSEFGKKASQGDSLIKDLALSDEKIISSAIFGGMKDDLREAYKAATGSDRTALGMLIKARNDVSKASTEYNNTVAQGIPAWLKDKSLAEINFEDLYKQYKAATPEQRAVFRTYAQNTSPESLKNFDSRVWQEFSSKYTTELADGMPGIDLARMSQDWVKTSAQDKDAIATALGQNLSEFDKRMKDALVFTRRVATGQPQGDGLGQVTREVSAVVGASPAGYQGAKATQLAGDIFGMFRSGGISNELAMKTLLTPEGASFLKTAKLSPGSQKTLQSLTEMANAPSALPAWMSVAAPVVTAIQPTVAPAQEAVDQWIDPDAGTQPAPMQEPAASEQQWIDPDAGTTSPTQSQRDQGRAAILKNEYDQRFQALQTATDPAVRQRLQIDLNSLQQEIGRMK